MRLQPRPMPLFAGKTTPSRVLPGGEKGAKYIGRVCREQLVRRLCSPRSSRQGALTLQEVQEGAGARVALLLLPDAEGTGESDHQLPANFRLLHRGRGDSPGAD